MVSWIDRSGDQEGLARAYVEAAERGARAPAGIDPALAKPIEQVAIVGGGLMGSGIAAACLLAGLAVSLIEQDEKAAETAKGRINGLLDGAVKRSKLDAEGKAACFSRLRVSLAYDDVRDADLAIEAVFEDVKAKREVFQKLAGVLPPKTSIATNTSYLDPMQIGAGIEEESRILGLHFFSPAHVMKLLEVVRTPKTSKETLSTAFAFARRLGKVAVLAGICDGFIGNRMLQAYRRQADYMLLDGCLPHEIDQAMRAFGMPMGPYELQDLTGLQISFANRRRLDATRDPSERYVTLGDRLCEMGRLGQRAGRGWYRYEPDDRTPHRDQDVEQLIEATSRESGIERQTFSEDEIQRRLLAVLINEGGHILDEGIAGQPSDVDLVKIHGYGFPRSRGGPMFLGEQIGLGQVLAVMQEVSDQSPGSWRMASYLQSASSSL